MKKGLYFVLALIVIFGGIYFLTKKPVNGPDALPVSANVITYTDRGFSPATITVKQGTTVTFQNASSQGVWPASAFHPTHTAYPTAGGCIGSTFDACSEILPGSTWQFTFDIAGSWKYHNHLNPPQNGAVVVE